VGYNPDIEELLEILTGEIQERPACALAQVTLPIAIWTSIDNETKVN
jgi:hypothetical protein